MAAPFNTWLPGGTSFLFGTGVTTSVGSKDLAPAGTVFCQTFTIPNAQAGFGITYDQITPNFTITKPPKVAYSSTSDMIFVLQDSAGWFWSAPCPMQVKVAERGWAWNQFQAHNTQTNAGDPPALPATGRIKLFQFGGATGVHGAGNNVAQSINIAYITARTPAKMSTGTIRKVVLTDVLAVAHTLKVGDMALQGGTRKPIKYLGALPFGLQANGPRNRLAVLPYRGPIIAGYQDGGPWVSLSDNASLGAMLDFMLDAQTQFQNRSPTKILGPFMHIYLQALWDCEQNGVLDTWVWDGPDGNPAWDGWQYRAFDNMSRTWAKSKKTGSTISSDNQTKLQTICTRFLDWLYSWLLANPNTLGVPNDWRPPGWTQGNPLPPTSYLDPKFAAPSGHDIALSLKATVFCQNAGYDLTKAKYVIHRLILALKPIQFAPTDTTSNSYDMRGAFTQNPVGFEVYGFEQGEIMEALALAKQNPTLLVKAKGT